jgi:eukaryotic-like serine/threonine-protein kinase
VSQLPVPAYAPGAQLYKYNLVSALGQGQFGQVWLANDLALQRQYAIKILNPGVPVDQRLREARIGHTLNHNNLVRVHQADVLNVGHDHVVIIAMDYVPAGSITRRVNPQNFLPLPEVLRAGKDILQGLDYLHANGFYHNDIKPENILIGSAGQAMLTDYGIVGISAGGQPVPAPGAYRLHMAPEVLAGGNINIQTDIYQVGLSLFRLACGVSCLRTKLTALGWADYCQAINAGKLIGRKDFPSHVPNRLQTVILRATDADPNARYQSALEMRRALEKLAFAGHWTIDQSGNMLGINGHNEFRFEKQAETGDRFSLTTFRRNTRTGNETRASKFCARDLSPGQADKLLGTFIKYVVAGS